jgi:hypothetical protein
LEQKVIGRTGADLQKEASTKHYRYLRIFSQLNLSWLTSILVPPHRPRKGLVNDALSQGPRPERRCAKDVKTIFTNRTRHG